MQTRAEIAAYLEEADRELAATVEACRPIANRRGARWSPAQLLDHLIRTERYLYLLFRLLPLLARLPRPVVRALDLVNKAMCKAAGMSTRAGGHAKPDGLRAAARWQGRYVAPAFLRPPARDLDLDALLETRRRVRARTLATLAPYPWEWFERVTWTHPEIGAMPLGNFFAFLGVHDERHLGQMRDQLRAGTSAPA